MTGECICCGEYSGGISPTAQKCWYCMSYCSEHSSESVKNRVS